MTANNRSNSERREGLQEQSDALVRAEVFHQNASEKRQHELPQISCTSRDFGKVP